MAAVSGVVSLASKFRGCLIGSHVGDCFGSPFEGEFPVSKTVLSKYLNRWLEDPPDKSPLQVQSYTDDTAMTLCMAKSLTANNGLDPKDMSRRFVEEYVSQPRRGYGSHVVDVFKALAESEFHDVFKPAKQQFGGSGSYGNGSAMRIAPVALYGCNREDEMLKVAKESSLITHAHQNGYNGAILQCFAIHQALKTNPSTEFNPVNFVNNLLERMASIEEPIANVGSLEDSQPYCSSLKKIREMFEKSKNMTPEAVAEDLGNYVCAHKSVPTAIYSFLKSLQPLEDFQSDNPFVRAMYFSVACGGDTDTIAAMAGSISGAYHGEDIIPKNFEKRCEALDESRCSADEMFALCCGS